MTNTDIIYVKQSCIPAENRWTTIQFYAYFLVSGEQVALLHLVLQPLLQLGDLTFLLLQLAVKTLTCISL